MKPFRSFEGIHSEGSEGMFLEGILSDYPEKYLLGVLVVT